MDIFPIALPNRDMNSLMSLIEHWAGEATRDVDLPGVDPYDIDGIQAAVSQMGPPDIDHFLRKFEAGLAFALKEWFQPGLRDPGVRPYLDQKVETVRELRGAIAAVRSIRSRVRRPRGK